MMKRLAGWYCDLFLLDQALGVATSVTGILSPNIYLYWLHSFEASVWSLLMMTVSLLFPLLVWRKKLPRVLYLLPAYHLGGLLLMQLHVVGVRTDLARHGWFLMADAPDSAANFAALQDFDVTMLSLGHSAIGIVIGVVVMIVSWTALRARPVRSDRSATAARP